ncbi:PepSY domain-containing protein [Sphingomonas sp.]|uniref:PepSY domain-containing protein n=1 Tax=Sphingomonas sp. TaxID=28214 RepID=UPI003CC5FB0E
MVLLVLFLLTPGIGLQVAHHRTDQWRVFEQRREGRILPLREIEGRVVPTMRGADYLGFEFDGSTGVYTLKFLRDGAVIWVEVDGRSGQVIGRTGG